MIKAIETKYKGYRFRSRLEARWAVFFEALGIEWAYEYEGFDLPVGPYLPDFLLRTYTKTRISTHLSQKGIALPEHWDLWVEIKGTKPSSVELMRIQQLAEGLRVVAMLIIGTPGTEVLYLTSKPSQFPTQIPSIKNTTVWSNLLDLDRDVLASAYASARSARFEHGEKPQ